jgi:pimeloyl-ACP methyl ester carboxylesterase
MGWRERARGWRAGAGTAGAAPPKMRAGAIRQFEVDGDEPILALGMDDPARALLIAFGGMKLSIGIPPFEFLNMTSELPVKRLFLRDLEQAWYHRGVPGHGESLPALADDLRGLIERHQVSRLVLAGSSAGGYAVLVLGGLLGADVVLSFSPQTIIEPEALAQMHDDRWDQYVEPLIRDGRLDRRWSDVRAVLGDPQQRRGTRYEVFFDDTMELDRAHAERLEGIPAVHLRRYAGGSHNLVRTLRDSGELKQVLTSALAS